MLFTPTRQAGLERLTDFLPRAGRTYTYQRNHDNGTPASGGPRTNVSQLSPWLHVGLLSEDEVINAVLAQHSPQACEKFIAEVFWRVYFKGYLEQRPSIWSSYCETRDAALARLEGNAGLRKAYQEAEEGRTGIAAFDHWAHELTQTGYLHNHARMWFASIWIFTLKLDWELGADFFLRHLIDADAASNTLSWRWVGGLHTKGKTYLARPDNIARYTADHAEGPLAAQRLAEDAPALSEPVEHTRRKLDLPNASEAVTINGACALLLHDEAASHVPLNLPFTPDLIITAARPAARSPGTIGEAARTFAEQSVSQAGTAACEAFGCNAVFLSPEDDLGEMLAKAGIDTLILPYLPTGWTRDCLMPQIAPLIEAGRTHQILSDLERATWPHAKAGFFGVKKQIDAILREIGTTG